MTKEQLAEEINGNEYGNETTNCEARAKTSGLVVVYGSSDDLVEFAGAIYDEVGAGNGTMIQIDAKGVLPIERDNDWEDSEMLDYLKRKKTAATITSRWCAPESKYAWTFETDLPHACFDILEDGEPFCRGIVIDTKDLPGGRP